MPFENYVKSAIKFSSENPLSTSKRLFVSSEDPDVIRATQELPNGKLISGIWSD